MQGSRYVFTINNFREDHVHFLRNAAPGCKYLVFGYETGASGTPHLQGFVIFQTNHRLRAAKAALSPDHVHVERAKGTSAQAADYCKKEGHFEEFGQAPTAGKTNRFADFKEWVLAQPTKPTAAIVAEQFPSIFLQYGRCMEWIDLIYPRVVELVDDPPRPYQQHLADKLSEPADDRKIIFVIDPNGGTGKSWFVKYWCSVHPSTQVLSIGKRDDVAFQVDPVNDVFLFDIPRSQSEFLQYPILEMLKDRRVTSPKYQSRIKHIDHQVHVVVFMNEPPDMTKLSRDRYVIINWLSLE